MREGGDDASVQSMMVNSRENIADSMVVVVVYIDAMQCKYLYVIGLLHIQTPSIYIHTYILLYRRNPILSYPILSSL